MPAASDMSLFMGSDSFVCTISNNEEENPASTGAARFDF
jgi:hypothetical protein